jgi:hypothetical protein
MKILMTTKAGRARNVEIAEATLRLLSQCVRKAAFDVQAHAQSLVRVDTGALKNSIYVVTDQADEYGPAMATATQRYLTKYSAPPKSRPHQKPKRKLEAVVAVGMEYGAEVEYTVEPYLRPAAEAVRPGYQRACTAAMGTGR